MAAPVLTQYALPSPSRTLVAGRRPGSLAGSVTLDDAAVGGAGFQSSPSSLAGNVASDDASPGGAGLGTFNPSSTLLALLAAAPAGPTWVKANTNNISAAFPPPGYITTGDTTTGSSNLATAVIRCWSGFAVDTNRARLNMYGGGHANYHGNEHYVFDMYTRQWQLGFYPTDVVQVSGSHYRTVDGDLHSPVSSHTYGNNHFLPVLDKFVTFGGAAANTGGSLLIGDDAPNPDRVVGCMTLDVSQACQGKVAGVTGSNVKHGHSVSLPGANAWAVRDWLLDHSAAATMTGPDPENSRWVHLQTGGAYRQEGGKDVIYKYSKYNNCFWRIQFNDADYHNDQISLLGINAGTDNWDSAPAISPGGLFMALGGDAHKLHGYDVSQWAVNGTVTNFLVPPSGINASATKDEWLADPYYLKHGIVWDNINGYFMIWNGGSKTYKFTHGGGSLNSNWDITKVTDDVGTAGVDRPLMRSELGGTGTFGNDDTSTLGKFKWAPNLNCAIGLQHVNNGDVWLFKPANWVAP